MTDAPLPGGRAPGFDRNFYLMVGGGLLAVIGSFMDWATAFDGIVTKSGLDGDGVITLITGLAMAVLAYLLTRKPSRRLGIAFGLVASVTVVIAIIDLFDIGGTEGASIGVGLWIVLVGGLAGIAGFILQAREGDATAA